MLYELLAVILVLGLLVGLARQFLDPPFYKAAVAVAIVILLLWLLRFVGAPGPWYRP
jgi:hypothetical protein